MFETVFHVGTAHPSLLWILATGIISFGLGLVIGMYSGGDTDHPESATTTNIDGE